MRFLFTVQKEGSVIEDLGSAQDNNYCNGNRTAYSKR